MSDIMIWVPGVPAPGGSKRAFSHAKTGRMVVVDACERNKEWRETVATFARAQYHRGKLLDGPIGVEFVFYMPRPKSHYGTGSNANVLKRGAPPWHTTRPDVLKLTRAVEDALTGIVWTDDARIVSELLEKPYSNRKDVVGVEITVKEFEE